MRIMKLVLCAVVALCPAMALAQFVTPDAIEDAAPAALAVDAAPAAAVDAAPTPQDVAMGLTTTDVAGLVITTPTGTPAVPAVTVVEVVTQGKDAYNAFKDGKILAGIGIVLSLLLTLALKLTAILSKNPSFMAKDWFRKAVPLVTFGLSAVLVVITAFAMKLPTEDIIQAIIGVGTGAIAWWETVGQNIFKKPTEMAAAAAVAEKQAVNP